MLIDEVVKEILDSLTKRERLIITKRYGFNKDKIYTQGEIASIINVSRGRISQLETNIIASVTSSNYFSKLTLSLKNSTRIILESLADGDGSIKRDEINNVIKKLYGEKLFAINIVYKSVIEWLNKVTRAGRTAWYINESDYPLLINSTNDNNGNSSSISLSPKPNDEELQKNTEVIELILIFDEEEDTIILT